MRNRLVPAFSSKKVLLIISGVLIITFSCGWFAHQILSTMFPNVGNNLSNLFVSIASGAYASFIIKS